MDIQKEREAFEAYFKDKYPELYKDVFNEDGDDRAIIGYSFAWSAWQAKAQAIPEGFVVLKISEVREVLSNASDAMCDEVASIFFNETGIPSTWYDHHLIAEKNILDAIEAQEPTND